VRADEWEQVRELRLEALGDRDAAMAFFDTRESAQANTDEFWMRRATDAASGDGAAQFVGIDGTAWVASATALVREPGSLDHLARAVRRRRVDVVGVYVRPSHRGTGLIDALFQRVAAWAGERGIGQLILDVHVENARARAAYRRVGFVETGTTFTGPIGDELEMIWNPAGSPGAAGSAGIVPA
jgi:GNAT superfamily N-acetyltransferase